MKMKLFFTLLLSLQSVALNAETVKGFSLTETWGNSPDATIPKSKYDDTPDNKNIVDKLYELGVRRINLSPQANMRHPRQSFVKPSAPNLEEEYARMARLIHYIHGKGMTVGIRPILFVLGKDGQPGYTETRADGTTKYWWHGNIQPRNPEVWFEHYRNYLSNYYKLGKLPGVEEFTIGAELYSMTVGLEKEWPAQPYGFPGQWVQVLKEAKKALPAHISVMYDINFTDDSATDGDLTRYGGEWARWMYRLTGFAEPDAGLVEFWNGLDAIGIDNYRSLIAKADLGDIPEDYDELVGLLESQASLYARQIGQDLDVVADKLRTPKKMVVLKELGFASRDVGFYLPFEFASRQGSLNIAHQSAAYEATMRAFWAPKYSWMKGIVFWDASVDNSLHGKIDTGFSVLGKEKTEDVLRRYWR